MAILPAPRAAGAIRAVIIHRVIRRTVPSVVATAAAAGIRGGGEVISFRINVNLAFLRNAMQNKKLLITTTNGGQKPEKTEVYCFPYGVQHCWYWPRSGVHRHYWVGVGRPTVADIWGGGGVLVRS